MAIGNYAYDSRGTLTFAAVTTGDIFYDLRNIAGLGALVYSSKVSTGRDSQQYVIATNALTGALVRIPKNDFWAIKIN